MTLGVGATGLMVAGGPPHGIPVVQARLHVGGMQGTGHPTGLQPEKPGGNLTPARSEKESKVRFFKRGSI